MSVSYSFLDKNKKVLKTFPIEACFYRANDLLKDYGNKAVYVRYDAKTNLTKEEVFQYITFLNSTRHFYKINVTGFMKNYTYTFKIKRQNSLRTFALLTAIRYIDEETKAVEFILKNMDNKNLTKLRLLLLSGIYTVNNGHFLNMRPILSKDFINYKIPKLNRTPDNKVTQTGLHKFYSNYKTTWAMNEKVKQELVKHYEVKLL